MASGLASQRPGIAKMIRICSKPEKAGSVRRVPQASSLTNHNAKRRRVIRMESVSCILPSLASWLQLSSSSEECQ